YGAGGSSSCADWTSATPTACGAPPDNPPTVATAARANPAPVTATTTAVSVLGADDGGEPALVYTWGASGPAAVTFSANGTNAANQTGTGAVAVTVNQTATTVAVAPSAASVRASETQQFASTVYDQFVQLLAMQPAATWSVAGGGTISSTGLFTAGQVASGP